ncbi:MAG: DNA methyltransferase [Bacteroidetes bacterium]|nr:DNA methyltransferase [Bacteroidota bacterium]
MRKDYRKMLAEIQEFPQLIKFLRDEMDWPISAEDFDEITFDYSPEELGLDAKSTAKISEIKRLRALEISQSFRVFFLKFEHKSLPIEVLRRVLGYFVNSKHSGAPDGKDRWSIEDLLFISNFGEEEQRRICFAHFTPQNDRLPKINVLGWDDRDTELHLDYVAQQLIENLTWIDNLTLGQWSMRLSDAFTIGHGQVIKTSKELSVQLALLARRIRKRIRSVLEIEAENGSVTQLMKSFQKILVHDIDRDTFSDTVAQTIAYGLLSARIVDADKSSTTSLTQSMRSNPLLQELLNIFLRLNDESGNINFDELGVNDIEDLLNHTDIESVIRDFGDQNPREDPVIHFYENFLAEYDKQKKVERGVFYTPRPVVLYIVESTDALLRDQFGLEDGLADTSSWGDVAKRNKHVVIPEGVSAETHFVQILDPATGTGTFLVEVIDRIYRTLEKKWGAEIVPKWNEYVSKHLLPRLFGYELLIAPYVIAHFKITLKLLATGYHFESDHRAQIYLTNALEPPRDQKQLTFDFALQALANEGIEVDKIKRYQRFTVIVGNPPYSGHSANKGAWIKKLLHGETGNSAVENYFSIGGQSLNERNPKWLNDDYVKFFRLAHWQIERTGIGVVGFITNHGFLDNVTYRGMRESLVSTFGTQYLLNLHGSTKKGGTPDGDKDENVFDIQQGVAIGLFIKRGEDRRINYANLWGVRENSDGSGKYGILERNNVGTMIWSSISPSPSQWFLIPCNNKLMSEYESGWKLTNIFPINSVGIVTARDKLTIQFTKENIHTVVEKFSSLDVEEARNYYNLSKDSRDWKVSLAQKDIQKNKGQVYPILYRPFDIRYTYYTGNSRGFICMPRPDVMRHMLIKKNQGSRLFRNIGLVSCRQQSQIGTLWKNFLVTSLIIESCTVSNKTKEIGYLFPLYSISEEIQEEGIQRVNIEANINSHYIRALEKSTGLCYCSKRDYDSESSFAPDHILAYIYAIFHSITYSERYRTMLQRDFPHIPLPIDKNIFQDLVSIGSQLVEFHLLESDKLHDLPHSFFGSDNSKIGRIGWSNGIVWLDAEKVIAGRGYRATKPGSFGFRNVPENVWDFRIGSYQVCHKWLDSRKGRVLSKKDVTHYYKILHSLKETISLMGCVDNTIELHGGWTNAFIQTKI